MKRVPSIPGRNHKMVVVDFSNPFLRDFFPKWLEAHKGHLDAIRESLPAWAAAARADEESLARRGKQKPRPLAVVFDIDEVLLCNVQLNGYQVPANVQGPEAIDFHAADFFTDPRTGKAWGREDPHNPLLPGAEALVGAAVAEGFEVFFITGRLESIRDETVENFRVVNLAADGGAPLTVAALRRRGPGEVLTMCPDAAYPPPGASIRPFKEKRRGDIEKTHRIVLNAGDQPSDLGLYGDRQYYLPHPFYFTP